VSARRVRFAVFVVLAASSVAFAAGEPPVVFGPPIPIEGEELNMSVDADGVGISVFDWDKDGKKDLIGGNLSNVLYWYRNVGTDKAPAFERGQLLAGQSEHANAAPRIAACDWNNDGIPDLVVGIWDPLWGAKPGDGRADRQLTLYLGTRDGKLAPPVPISTKDGKNLFEMTGAKNRRPAPCVVDWNHDGKKDLVLGNQSGNIYVFLNVGPDAAPEFDGRFIEIPVSRETITTWGPWTCEPEVRSVPSVGDVSGDGKKDLVVGIGTGRVFVLLNEGTDAEPKFGAPSLLWQCPKRDTYFFPAVPCVCDWDGDGKNEILVGTESQLTLLKLAPAGDAVASVSVIKGKGIAMGAGWRRHMGPFSVDLDGDGLQDLIIMADGRQLTDEVRFYKNYGTKEKPVFRTSVVIQRDTQRAARYTFADFNGDGLLDLFGGSKYHLTSYVALNTGTKIEPKFFNGYIAQPVFKDGANPPENGYIAEPVFKGGANPPEGVKVVLLDDGKPLRFSDTKYAIDMDGDGLVDVVEADAAYELPKEPNNGCIWYRNIGTKTEPKFKALPFLIEVDGKQVCGAEQTIWPCDLDGDGATDVLVPSGHYTWKTPERKSGVALLRNKAGKGNVPVFESPVFLKDTEGKLLGALDGDPNGAVFVGTGDLNGDGVIDLMQTNGQGDLGAFECWIRYGRKAQ
jgi:hypothetical protein